MIEKQEKLIEKLQGVLNFLKNAEITSEDSLVCIDKPLDDLLSSLKHIPSKPSFNDLPTEVKTDILGYLCEAGALVAASVCKEWSQIAKRRLKNIGDVTVGNHCTNVYKCDDDKCFMPSEILKALADLELNIPVSICHPLTDVDSSLVVEGLTSSSSLILAGNCTSCGGPGEPILTNDQLKLLFDALENKEIMERVELKLVDLTDLDQDRLVKKTKCLSLHETSLDVGKLVGKLKNSTDSKLISLDLNHLDYPDELSEDMADALCNVEAVVLGEGFSLKRKTAYRLRNNILTRSTVIRYLSILEDMDWRTIICSDCLKLLLNMMIKVVMSGRFTTDQQEAANSCPGVFANEYGILK